jgi:hypothetical protein
MRARWLAIGVAPVLVHGFHSAIFNGALKERHKRTA